MTIIILIVAIIISLFVGAGVFACIYIFSFKNRKKIIKKAQIEAKKIIDNANIESQKMFKQKSNKLKIQENNIKKELLENEEFLNTRNKNLIERENILDKLEKRNVEKQKNIIIQTEKINKELESLSGISSEKAKTKLLNNLEYELKKDMNKKIISYKFKLNLKLKKISEDIISNAIEKYSPMFVADKTISMIKLKNDEIKGRIIGKEGRNIRAFEKLTGVDLLINDTPGVIRLSSFNSKRREIAKITLLKLIESGKFQVQKIENYLIESEKEFDNHIFEIGEQIVQELNLEDVDSKMYKYLGLLKYRTSYGQNVLEHSIEVGKIAASMAIELDLDSSIALRAGLFHDIGKSIDQDIDGSHVTIGSDIANKCNENNFIINAIESHHGDVEPNNVYSILVSAADTLSAARPGARNNTIDNFIQRMIKIEEICTSIEGVVKCYAFQSGREIRVIVDSAKIDDYEIYNISKKIKKLILESDVIIAGNIVVTVVREKIAVEQFFKKNIENIEV